MKPRKCPYCYRQLPTFIEHVYNACAVCILLADDPATSILSARLRAALQRLIRMRAREDERRLREWLTC